MQNMCMKPINSFLNLWHALQFRHLNWEQWHFNFNRLYKLLQIQSIQFKSIRTSLLAVICSSNGTIYETRKFYDTYPGPSNILCEWPQFNFSFLFMLKQNFSSPMCTDIDQFYRNGQTNTQSEISSTFIWNVHLHYLYFVLFEFPHSICLIQRHCRCVIIRYTAHWYYDDIFS